MLFPNSFRRFRTDVLEDLPNNVLYQQQKQWYLNLFKVQEITGQITKAAHHNNFAMSLGNAKDFLQVSIINLCIFFINYVN